MIECDTNEKTNKKPVRRRNNHRRMLHVLLGWGGGWVGGVGEGGGSFFSSWSPSLFGRRIDPRIACCALDVGFGETDAQMIRFGQLMVVHFDQCQHRFVHGAELQQRHLAVLAAMRKRKRVICGVERRFGQNELQRGIVCALTGKT